MHCQDSTSQPNQKRTGSQKRLLRRYKITLDRDRPLMTFDFRGVGRELTPQKLDIFEGKNKTLEGKGVKNWQKSSDVIYGRSSI